MSFMLAGDVGVTQWVLLGLILVLIVLYPVFMVIKNKKEREKFDTLSQSLKVGEKVLTSSGIYGEIVSISQVEQGKLVTLLTGDEEHKGFISVDVLAIYTVFKDEKAVEFESEVKEIKETQVKEEPQKQSTPKPKKSSKTSSKEKKTK